MFENLKRVCSRQSMINAIKFMKLLRVEPYLFLIFFQMSLKYTPSHYLLQDKICRYWYNQSVDYCYHLPETKEYGPAPGHFKSQILADVAVFGTYVTYISTVPAIVWALFVGAWIDRYIKARKILMLFSVGSAIIENLMSIYLSVVFDSNVYYHLLLHIPTSLCGGHIASRIAIIHYMTSTTPPKLMAMRIMILEMCHFVANPIGQSLGGYIIMKTPLFATGEIRNFTLCFIIALAFECFAFLLIIFMVDEKVARKQELNIEMKINGNTDKRKSQIKLRSDMSKEDKAKHPLRLLFDLDNVRAMVSTFIKKRPNKARTQLFMILFSTLILIISFIGSHHISGPFTQKIYLWKPDWDAYMKSLNMVIHSIATLTIVPFLIKIVNVPDVPLAIIGFCSYFGRNLILGIWLHANAYYVSLAISSVGGLSHIGIRAHMTKIVDRDEMGKVMSFISAVDTMAPILANTMFTFIFKYTMDTYPGLIYQITAGLVIFPIAAFLWIEFYTERPFSDDKKKDDIIDPEGNNIANLNNKVELRVNDQQIRDEKSVNNVIEDIENILRDSVNPNQRYSHKTSKL